MNNSINQEIFNHIASSISDYVGTDIDELHHNLFNTNHYIVGTYQAGQWLKQHDLSAFEAIDFVQEYERSNFGETHTKINAEAIVNMLVYIVGEQVLWECLNNCSIDSSEGLLTEEQAETIAEYCSENN